MKKFYLILFSAILLTSCTNSSERNEVEEYPYDVYEVTYKEHTYVVFKGCSGSHYSGVSSGVVHSPDCPKCKDK